MVPCHILSSFLVRSLAGFVFWNLRGIAEWKIRGSTRQLDHMIDPSGPNIEVVLKPVAVLHWEPLLKHISIAVDLDGLGMFRSKVTTITTTAAPQVQVSGRYGMV